MVLSRKGMDYTSSIMWSGEKVFVKGNRQYSEKVVMDKTSLSEKNDAEGKETEADESSIIQVFDGKIFWSYDKSKKKVEKVDLTKLSPKIQHKIRASQNNINIRLPEGLEFSLEEKKEQGEGSFFILTSLSIK